MKIKLTRRGEIVRDVLIGSGLLVFFLFVASIDSILERLFTGF